MTIQEAIKDLQGGDEDRIAECLDTGNKISNLDATSDWYLWHVSTTDVLSTRWITRDAQ